jgi:hypothetical protein
MDDNKTASIEKKRGDFSRKSRPEYLKLNLLTYQKLLFLRSKEQGEKEKGSV